MGTATATFETLLHSLYQSMGNQNETQALLDAHPLFAQFVKLAQHGTLNQKREFLYEYPVFLSMSIASCLCQDDALLESFGEVFCEFGVEIGVSGNQIQITTHDEWYAVGKGPIERLWAAVDADKITIAQALASAHDLGLACPMSSIYVSALSRANLAIMRTKQFQRAAWQQRVVMATIESIDPTRALINADDLWAIRKWSGAAWIEIATYSFLEVADLRVFAQANEVADRLIAEAEHRNDTQFLGRILLRTAILYLDPFTAGRPAGDGYGQSIERWCALGLKAMGADAAAAKKHFPMPEPSEALRAAIALFRKAIAVGKGFDQMVLYAAYAQALYRARLLRVPVDLDELRQVATKGLALAKDSGDYARIKQTSDILQAVEQLGTVRRVRLSDLKFWK